MTEYSGIDFSDGNLTNKCPNCGDRQKFINLLFLQNTKKPFVCHCRAYLVRNKPNIIPILTFISGFYIWDNATDYPLLSWQFISAFITACIGITLADSKTMKVKYAPKSLVDEHTKP